MFEYTVFFSYPVVLRSVFNRNGDRMQLSPGLPVFPSARYNIRDV